MAVVRAGAAGTQAARRSVALRHAYEGALAVVAFQHAGHPVTNCQHQVQEWREDPDAQLDSLLEHRVGG